MRIHARIHVGEIEALFRYPVKSMRGAALEEADLGWHGLDGDRRLALRRINDRGGFPWLTASSCPELLLYAPVYRDVSGPDALPTHVRTPDGAEQALFGQALADDIASRQGSPVEMTHLDRGIFDEASVSAISSASVGWVAERVGQQPDARRFRPNIVIALPQPDAFAENAWVGGVLSFGEGSDSPAIAITNWDVRCAMINIDPDSGLRTPEVLKTVVRERDNKAGVYGTVVRRGRLAVGQPLFFAPAV